MAEGFANHYGGDVLIAASAGLSPIPDIPGDTILAMGEMNIDVSGHVPRHYDPLEAAGYDIVVNMAGLRLPGRPPKEVIEWQVNDPFRARLETYREVRNELEQRVMRLILDLRREARR